MPMRVLLVDDELELVSTMAERMAEDRREMGFITTLMMLFAGASLYLLCRRMLGFSHWPAIGAALFFALSPWTPVRLRDGNPTETY